MSPFEARFYSPDSAQSEQASIEVGAGGLQILQDGTQPKTLLFSELDLKLGGQDGKRVIITDTASGGTLITADLRILDAMQKAPGGDLLNDKIKTLHQGIANIPKREIKHWGILVAVVAIIGLIAFASVDLLVGVAAQHVPVSAEKYIGDLVLKSYKSDHTLLESGPEVDRVRGIVDRLATQLPKKTYDLHVYVEPSDDVNAMAMPGGNIVVLSGLLRQASNDSEVAGVLGHEIGHVMGRHTLKAAVHRAGLFAILQLIFGGFAQEQAAWLSGFVDLDRMQFGRTQEDEADRTGVSLAHKSDYDPHGLIRFFEKMQAQEKASVLNSKALEILSTHPCTPDRIQRIKAEIAKIEHPGTTK